MLKFQYLFLILILNLSSSINMQFGEFRWIFIYPFILMFFLIFPLVECSKKRRRQTSVQTNESLIRASGMQKQSVMTTDKGGFFKALQLITFNLIKKVHKRKNRVKHMTRVSFCDQDISDYQPSTHTRLPLTMRNVM